MHLFYNLAIRFYTFGIWTASFFNEKARFWIAGRRGVFKKLKNWKSKQQNAKTIWLHAASLGEFEQGRPIIEALKRQYPNVKIVLTFFSPSGYEIRKNYPSADLITYLPADYPKDAKRFIEIIQPDLAVFIKYEFWYNYLLELQSRNIPTLLVSALFRPEQHFFQWYGSWFKKILNGFEHIFVQNEASFQLLIKHQIPQVSLSGDTRIDRVVQISRETTAHELIKQFAENQPVLVCGSTWPADEKILSGFIKNSGKWKFIIAPHEIDEKHLGQIENILPGSCIRYSKVEPNHLKEKKILIIDNIGMLASLYQYGKLAYIGGGFGSGIHNILEPAAFHLPVLFGPNYRKFEEANTLIEKGAAFSISDRNHLHSIIEKLEAKAYYRVVSEKAAQYIRDNQGATANVLLYISKFLK